MITQRARRHNATREEIDAPELGIGAGGANAEGDHAPSANKDALGPLAPPRNGVARETGPSEGAASNERIVDDEARESAAGAESTSSEEIFDDDEIPPVGEGEARDDDAVAMPRGSTGLEQEIGAGGATIEGDDTPSAEEDALSSSVPPTNGVTRATSSSEGAVLNKQIVESGAHKSAVATKNASSKEIAGNDLVYSIAENEEEEKALEEEIDEAQNLTAKVEGEMSKASTASEQGIGVGGATIGDDNVPSAEEDDLASSVPPTNGVARATNPSEGAASNKQVVESGACELAAVAENASPTEINGNDGAPSVDDGEAEGDDAAAMPRGSTAPEREIGAGGADAEGDDAPPAHKDALDSSAPPKNGTAGAAGPHPWR